MIRVSKLISRPEAGANLRLAVSGISGVTIPVRDLGRSIRFYSRVFGFRASAEAKPAPRRTAKLAAPGDARIALHECAEASSRPVPIHRRWGFLVDDLDRAREALWDLGVKVADDGGSPDQIRRWPNGRSLRVRDPDGNEIELIEECRDRAGELRERCPGRAAWRRWVRQGSCPAR